jgi:L-alanine-DL-glutamate epimerase-like enolase superfamily enzyme
MSDDLLAEPITITDGRIRVRDDPGVGARIDEEKLAHYRQG